MVNLKIAKARCPLSGVKRRHSSFLSLIVPHSNRAPADVTGRSKDCMANWLLTAKNIFRKHVIRQIAIIRPTRCEVTLYLSRNRRPDDAADFASNRFALRLRSKRNRIELSPTKAMAASQEFIHVRL